MAYSLLDGLDLPKKKPYSLTDDVPAPSSGALRRYVADPALTLAKGVIGAGEGLVGLADIPTLGRAGKALSDLTGFDPKRAKGMIDEYLTPEQRAANAAVQKADGILPTLGAIAQYPSVIPHAIIESLPPMLAGGALAKGARALGGVIGAGESVLAPAAARIASRGAAPLRAAIGEGAVSGGQTAEQIRQETPGGVLSPGQALLAAGSGALTGGIARGSAGLAKKLGISDIDVALAGGSTGRGGKGILRRTGQGFLTEGLFEEFPQSAQEQAAQNLALGKPIGEGVGQAAAMGLVTGGVQGGLTAAALPGRKPSIAEPPAAEAPPETFDQQFERAYGVPPGGLTAQQASDLKQQQAIRDIEQGPRAPAPFDAASYYEGFPPSEPPPPPADPLHAPDAGPISRAAGKAVDTGLAPNPYAPPLPEAFVPRAEVTQPPDLQMQNRDRSRPGSIAQMQAIANNPDYDRLGVGRSPNEAAPMVAVGANAPVIPETDFGRLDRVTMGDGSKLPFRYAVVEAPAVLASHSADGSVNGDYFAQVPPGTIRALNNGRIAALQEAYRRGTTESYRQAMIADAQAHGIAPEAIAGKKNPILVRVYDDAENARPNMAAISNPQLSLKPSAPETAQNDAVNLDVAGMIPDEAGNIITADNEPALRKFLATIPAAEQNELVSKTGFTKQFADRVRAAVFAKAYGNAEIVSQAVEDTDPETKNVLTAMTRAAPEFAKVDHGAPLDVRPSIVEAIGIIRGARARGLSASDLAAHPDLLGRDPMTQRMVDFIGGNARSVNRLAAGFAEAARFLQSEQAAKTSGDLFGRREANIGDLIARVNAHLEKLYGPEAVGIAAERQAPLAGREAAGTGSRGTAAPDGVGGQPDQQQGAAAATRAEQQQAPLIAIAPPDVVGLPESGRPVASITRADARAPAIPAELQLAIDQVRASDEIAKLPAQQQAVLLDHYQRAAQAKAGYDAALTKIAEAVNGRPMLASLKGIKRAVEKIQDDYAGDAGRIKDVLRGTVAVRTVEDAQDAVARILAAFDVTESGRRNLFAEGTPDPEDGYRDAKFNIRVNGIVAEIQVGIEEMLDAKENGPGHALYEKRQDLERSVGAREMTAEERAEKDSLNAQMRAVYGPAWAAATSARKSASETGAPLRRAEPGSNGRGGETSKQAQYGGEPQSKTTGIPSTSKNRADSGKDLGRDASIGDSILAEKGQKSKTSTLDAPNVVKEQQAFSLTGQPTQGDLFAAAQRSVLVEVEKKVDHERDTVKGKTAREAALRDLTAGGRVNLLAASINVDMIRDGAASLLGQTITSPKDLAALAQVYRDPRFETLRYVFTKGGKVVYQIAVSSRLPSMTVAFNGEWTDFIADMRRTMKETGADRFYMLHNHPSGNSMPSWADIDLTKHVHRQLSNFFAGHVIIDTNEYSLIDANGVMLSRKKADFGGGAAHLGKTAALGARADVLGRTIDTYLDMATVGVLVKNQRRPALIGMTGRDDGEGLYNVVTYAGDLDLSLIADPKKVGRTAGIISRIARASGSGGGMVLVNVPPEHRDNALWLLRKGVLRDALLESGENLRPMAGTREESYLGLGRGLSPKARVSVSAAQKQADYQSGDLFGNAEAINTKRRAAVKKKADGIPGITSSQLDLFVPPADTSKQEASNETSQRPIRGNRPQQPAGEPPAGVPTPVGGGGIGTATGEPASTGEAGNRPDLPGQAGTGVPAGGSGTGNGESSGAGTAAVPGGGRKPRPRAYKAPTRDGLNYRITRPETIGTGGDKAKYADAVAAIRTLKAIEAEGRRATMEEQEILARYPGWGGLKNAFFTGAPEYMKEAIARSDERGERSYYESGQSEEWRKERRELLALLTTEEYAEARASTPNAHYTAPQVINAMWAAVQRLGFQSGRILEPAFGVGHFFGMMPDRIAGNSTLGAVELDSLSARIGKQLYQKADVLHSGFEAAPIPDGFFDLAISNVPFGDFKVHDPKWNKHNLFIHDYFFAKALDKVRPGGVVAFITSDGTMDKGNPKPREVIARQGKFLGAIRLPNDAFKKNAGTEVTTDIIFLQRREKGDTSEGPAWIDTEWTATPTGEVNLNEYYIAHPEMMLGTMGRTGTMYGGQDAALKSDGRNLEAALAEAIQRLPENVYKEPAARTPEPQGEAPDGVRQGSLIVKSGRVLQSNGKLLFAVDGVDVAHVERMIAVRDAARSHLRIQIDPATTPLQFDVSRQALNDAYDAFVKAHGPFNAKANASMLQEEADYPLLLALENWNKETEKATKAAIFMERTATTDRKVTAVETPTEALTVSLNERGRVDIPHMAAITGLSEDEVIGGLSGRIYFDPIARTWEAAEAYLSGNVRAKLADAEAAARLDPRFNDNVEALKASLPTDIPAARIYARLGQPWIPHEHLREFAGLITGNYAASIDIAFSPVTATWIVKDKRARTQTPENQSLWGTEDRTAFELLDNALNGTQPTVRYKDEEGKPRVDTKATLDAREKLDQIKTRFEKWWREDADRAEEMARIYNDNYNNIRLRQYDGQHLTLPGSNPLVKLRKNVLDGAWRIISSGNTLLAHAVGAGKTWTAIAGSMERKRLGLNRKPMHVVLKSTLDQYAREWMQLYPNANLLVARTEDFSSPEARQRFVARAVTGNWDGIVLSHETFGRIQVSKPRQVAYIEERLRVMEEAYLEAKAGKDHASKRLVKELEKKKKRLKTKLDGLLAAENKDDLIDFETLGVDALNVDEAHQFKNLSFETRIQGVAGIKSDESQRAEDLYLKTRYINDVNNGRGGVVFMTGTPISNTMSEMFTMQRYLGPDALLAGGVGQFDAWASQYGQIVPDWELRVDGTFAPKSRFAKFVNMGELAQMFRTFADVKMAEDLNLPVPEIAGGGVKIITGPNTPELAAYMNVLVQRAELIRSMRVDKKTDNMLKLSSDARKASLDMRLVMPGAKDHKDSKVNQTIREVYRIWKDSKKTRAAQLVFCDMSTPNDKGWNIYRDVRDKLIKMGVPRSEIAFIQNATTDEKRDRLFDDVREGRVRIMMGSTQKMGTGVNVQKNLIAAHHLDAPWRPSDIEQRNGRIVRQGNQNKVVTITQAITEGSFDAFMWQTLERKAKFIGQALRADPSVREIEDVDARAMSYAELKAVATGDQTIIEKMKVETDLLRLMRSAEAHEEQRITLAQQAVRFEREAATLREAAAAAKQDEAALIDTRGDKFAMTINGTPYGDRKEAANGLAVAIMRAPAPDRDAVHGTAITTPLGKIGGFEFAVTRIAYNIFTGKHVDNRLVIYGKNQDVVGLGETADGNLQRLENAVASYAGRSTQYAAEANTLEAQAKRAKEQSAIPFDKQEQLDALAKRKEELDTELGIGKGDQRVEDDEEGDDDDEPPPRVAKQPQAPYEVVQSPSFQKWFGDSKAKNRTLTTDDIDAAATDLGRYYSKERVEKSRALMAEKSGKPRVYYHATTGDFDEFAGEGPFFVAEDPYDAAKVLSFKTGQKTPIGANIMPVYVKAENPFDPSNKEHARALADYLERNDPTIASFPRTLDDDNRPMDGGLAEHIGFGNWQIIERPLAQKWIRENFDGFFAQEHFTDRPSLAVFKSTQIKSAVSNSGGFDSYNPSIVAMPQAPYGANPPPPLQAALARPAPQPPKDAPEWVKKMPAEMQEALRKSGVWVHKKSLRERVRELMQNAGLKILQGTLDQFAPVLRRLGDYPYKLLRMASSYDAGLEASLFHGRLKVNSAGALEVQRGTKGLIEILKPLNGEVDRFLSWVAGNRAEGLKAEDRENLFGDTDIGQLKSLNRKLHSADNFPNGQPGDARALVYARVLRDYNEFSKAILDIAESSGLINAEGRKTWERDFYVPFYREAEEQTAPIGNVSGMVNQYAFKRLKGGTGVLQDLLSNSVQNWSHLLQASLKNRAAAETLRAAEQLGAAHKAGYKEKGSVYIRQDGKEVHYIVDDPLILDAVASLEAVPFRGPAMRFFGAFKQALTFGATVSPSFRIRNLIRDTVQSLAHGKGTYNPIEVWMRGFKYSSKDNPEFGNILAGGGIFQMGSHLEGNRADYIRRLTEKGVKAASILDTEAKTKAALSAAWDWWQETGNRAESVNRANRYREVYDALTAAGVDHDRAHFEAAYAARDIMDFSLHGKFAAVRMLTQMVPFMNARLQGMYKLGRAAHENPARFAAVVGGVALASIALMLASRGDPDWEEREEWDRDNNWWFKIGDKAFRIPKPFEIGALATVIERATEAAMNGMGPADRERFVNRLWPLIASQLAMNPIPQAISPAVQLWANKNAFTGRPIESEHDMKLPVSERIGPNTSQVGRILGKAGIMSPEQIDFTVNAYLAWVGVHALATLDLALRPLMGAPERPALRTDQLFVAGDFVKDLPATQSRFVSSFYEHLKKTQQAMGELRNAQQLGQLARAAELVAEGGADLRMAPVYSKVAREISQINARVRRVQASDMSADEKRAEIDRLNSIRNRMAQAAEGARERAVNRQGAT